MNCKSKNTTEQRCTTTRLFIKPTKNIKPETFKQTLNPFDKLILK